MSKRTEPVYKSCPVCGTDFPVCPPGKTSRYYPPNEQEFCSMVCQCKGRYRSGAKCNPLTPEQAAYIAGFLDADGSIFLYRRRNKVALRVAFSNNDRRVLDWISEVIGIGSVIRYDDGNRRHAIRFAVQVNAEAALTLLEQIAPYLIIKYDQALLGIGHQRELSDPASAADISWQQINFALMQDLNRRGPTYPPDETVNS